MCRDGQHRYPRAMAIEEPVDEVQVARSTASSADREIAGQMRLSASGESGDLFVPDMHPFDFSLAPNCVCQTVEAVADNAIYPLNPRRDEVLAQLICDRSRHICAF